MSVEKFMSKALHTCAASDTSNRAAQIMWDSDCGFLPVTDDRNHVIGVVTDRDLLMGAYTQGQPLAGISVASVMSTNVCVCEPEDTLATAEKLMEQRQVRRLPVVNGFGELVGVITLGDLARAAQSSALKKAVGGVVITKALAAICEPRPLAIAAE